jgi:hypothetical protein
LFDLQIPRNWLGLDLEMSEAAGYPSSSIDIYSIVSVMFNISI